MPPTASNVAAAMDSLLRLFGRDSSSKGKSRAVSPPPRPSSRSGEREPLLPRHVDDEALGSTSRDRQGRHSTSPGRTDSRASVLSLSHGRGPLMPDSDDEVPDDEESAVRARGKKRQEAAGAYGTIGKGSPHLGHDDEDAAAAAESQRKARFLFNLAFLFLAIGFVAFAIIHIYLGHIVSSTLAESSPAELASRGLVLRGPDAFEILDVEDDVVMIRAVGRVGVDVEKALGWEAKASKDSSRWSKWEAGVARWAVGKAGFATVEIKDPISIVPTALFDKSEDVNAMIETRLPTLTLPLFYRPASRPSTEDFLSSFSLSLPVRITSVSLLSTFANVSYHDRVARVEAVVASAQVKVGNAEAHGWVEGFIGKVGSIGIDGIRQKLDVDGAWPPRRSSGLPGLT